MTVKKKHAQQQERVAAPVNDHSGLQSDKKQRRKKKRKKTPIIIAVIVIVLLIVIRLVACGGEGANTAVVTTAVPIRGEIEETVNTSGGIQSGEQKVYFSKVTGVLGEVNVEAGDSVQSGDLLITYDMEQMESALQQAALQQEVNTSQYNSTLHTNAESQYKLQEADTNLAVLNQQIADHEAYLKQLQDKLAANQRETANNIAAEGYNLSIEATKLSDELKTITDAVDPVTGPTPEQAARIADLTKKISDNSTARTRNQYLSSVAASSDYVAEMNEEIANVTELLTGFREYKAKMEAQKSGSENTVLDSYQKEQYEASEELAKLTYAQAQEDYTIAKAGIVADFDGIVTDLTAIPGATVTGGYQLLTLANSEDVKVIFAASKSDLEKLSIGQKVDLTITNSKYEGEISKIDRMATLNASGTAMVNVEVSILNPDDKIILGLDAKLVVHTSKSDNALLVPIEAVNADQDGDFLYVAENGMVVRKPVVCGISSDLYIEITEGITDDDQVIITSVGDLQEGMAVVAMPAQ
jgi:RND family efflux transporter MFP subunit